MRLPSSSSLLLASLAVSSSSLSALAAPAGDGSESLPAPAPVPLTPVPPPSPFPPNAPIAHGGSDTIAQPNGEPTNCTIAFLSNTATGHDLQARDSDLVHKVVALLPPNLSNPILGLLDALPLIGKEAPKAREVPFDVVKQVPGGKTTRAEEAGGRGEHAASEDSPMQPFASQPGASTPPTAGRQDAPVAPLNPPAGCPSQPSPQSGLVRRQGAQVPPGQGEGQGGVPPDPPVHPPPSPPPPLPSQASGSGPPGPPGKNAGGGGG